MANNNYVLGQLAIGGGKIQPKNFKDIESDRQPGDQQLGD